MSEQKKKAPFEREKEGIDRSMRRYEEKKKISNWANIARTTWPKTARILDAISRNWDGEAKREDVRAEQDKFIDY